MEKKCLGAFGVTSVAGCSGELGRKSIIEWVYEAVSGVIDDVVVFSL